MCTFLVSAARGREASTFDDMVCMCEVDVEGGRRRRGFFYTWGPLRTNVGATVIRYGETWHRDKSKTNQKDEDIDHHKIPRQCRVEEDNYKLPPIELCPSGVACLSFGDCWVRPAPTLSSTRDWLRADGKS
jgi:hypothetical protein